MFEYSNSIRRSIPYSFTVEFEILADLTKFYFDSNG